MHPVRLTKIGFSFLLAISCIATSRYLFVDSHASLLYSIALELLASVAAVVAIEEYIVFKRNTTDDFKIVYEKENFIFSVIAFSLIVVFLNHILYFSIKSSVYKAIALSAASFFTILAAFYVVSKIYNAPLEGAFEETSESEREE